jgi:predicted MFS family arabinose efflux permease
VAGVALGGVVAARFGWRSAFVAVGAASLALVVLYPLVVRDYPTAGIDGGRRMRVSDVLRALSSRTAVFTYLASGFQMFIMGALSAWIPTYLGRYYGLAPEVAAVQGALVILVAGVGMIVGGGIVDRMRKRDERNMLRVPAAYAVVTFVLLTAAFAMPPGDAQKALLFCGVFLAGGHSGAAGAVIVEVVHPGFRAASLATVALANNLLGLAPGPFLVGALSDVYGLQAAMALAPSMCVVAAACFVVAARSFRRDAARIAEQAA